MKNTNNGPIHLFMCFVIIFSISGSLLGGPYPYAVRGLGVKKVALEKKASPRPKALSFEELRTPSKILNQYRVYLREKSKLDSIPGLSAARHELGNTWPHYVAYSRLVRLGKGAADKQTSLNHLRFKFLHHKVQNLVSLGVVATLSSTIFLGMFVSPVLDEIFPSRQYDNVKVEKVEGEQSSNVALRRLPKANDRSAFRKAVNIGGITLKSSLAGLIVVGGYLGII